MTNEDLEFIFHDQLVKRINPLRFVLIDQGETTIVYHPLSEIYGAVDALSAFEFAGFGGDGFPVFTK